MEKIDFSPVGDTVNGMAIQFGIVMIYWSNSIYSSFYFI
ncbi:Uncharacterised protein [Niallia circulans]|nr:Uncharacterised protein [Niallia circulans]